MESRIINPTIQRWKYILGDWLGIAVGFMLFNIVRYHLQPDTSYYFTLSQYIFSEKLLLEEIIIPIAFLPICWLTGYYNKVTEKSRLQELLNTLGTTLIFTAIIYFVMLINDKMPRRRYDYELIAILYGLLFGAMYIIRLTITSFAIYRFRHHSWNRNTIIVGERNRFRQITHRLNENKNRAGANILGYVDIDRKEGTPVSERPLHKDELTFQNIVELCGSDEVDQFVIACRRNNDSKVMHTLYKLFEFNVPIKIAPDELSFVTTSIRMSDVYGEPMLDLSSPSMGEGAKNVKRVLDVILSFLALIIISPILVLIAIAIKLTSRGPIIYSQERIGYRHKPFKIYKFRSMRTDAEASGPQLSSDTDPRVTPIGKFLRKYRFDELPQFWNVLKGDMALVGPRPERAFFIERIVKRLPYYTLLHQVRPGITSWGMVKYGYAKNIDEMVKRARFDLIYISNMSIAMDLKIMMHTIATIIRGKGV